VITATVNPWVYALELISNETTATAFPGESVTYSMTVENMGELMDTFDLALSGTYEDWGNLSPTSVSLAPYSIEEVLLTMDVPYDASGGDHKINVRAISQGDISKFKDLIFTTTVTPFVFDCEMAPENQYSHVDLGSSEEFLITVENTGNYQETINLEISGTKAEWGSLDTASITLSSGALEDVYLMIYVPVDSQPGNYYFTVKGTIFEDPYVSDSVRIRVIVPEDEPSTNKITISDVCHTPDSPNGDEPLTVTATVSGEEIRYVKLQLYKDTILFDSVLMQSLKENGYSTSYGPLVPGEYEYMIYVEDQFGNSFESNKVKVIVVEPPPEDSDEDGVYDDFDAFPEDETQWSDVDGDGFGDNPNGNNPDDYPLNPSKWERTDSSEDDDISWMYLVYLILIFGVMVVLLIARTSLKNKGKMNR
jgi:hypothetical protein